MSDFKADAMLGLVVQIMNGGNHELPKGSAIRCSGKSEDFLPHMAKITANQSNFQISFCLMLIYKGCTCSLYGW